MDQSFITENIYEIRGKGFLKNHRPVKVVYVGIIITNCLCLYCFVELRCYKKYINLKEEISPDSFYLYDLIRITKGQLENNYYKIK